MPLEPERPADRVHPHVAALHRDVPLRAGADQVAVAGEEQVGPVGAALTLEQPTEDGQRRGGAPVAQPRAVVPPDHEVGALAVADLLGDDPVDHRAVLLVGGLEAAAVLEGDLLVGQHREQLLDCHLHLGRHVHHGQRRPVVVGLEAALGDLPEGDREQPVEASALGRAVPPPEVRRPASRPRSGRRRPASRSRSRAAGPPPTPRAPAAQPGRRPGRRGREAGSYPGTLPTGPVGADRVRASNAERGIGVRR